VVGSSNSFVFEATSYVLIQFFHNPPPAGAKQLRKFIIMTQLRRNNGNADWTDDADLTAFELTEVKYAYFLEKAGQL